MFLFDSSSSKKKKKTQTLALQVHYSVMWHPKIHRFLFPPASPTVSLTITMCITSSLQVSLFCTINSSWYSGLSPLLHLWWQPFWSNSFKVPNNSECFQAAWCPVEQTLSSQNLPSSWGLFPRGEILFLLLLKYNALTKQVKQADACINI